MKVTLDVLIDSRNRNPYGQFLELSLSPENGEVNLEITGCDREVVVSLKQMVAALEVLERLQ